MPTEPEAVEPTISVLIPVFNERDSLDPLFRELSASLGGLGRGYEIIFVNDGSTDGSDERLDEVAKADPERVTVLHFRRNFGQTAALTAAIDHAAGEILIPLDADGQNDPADIPRLIAKLDEGYDLVSGWRRDRQDAFARRVIPSRVANWLTRKITGAPIHDLGCSLKAYRREIIDDVKLYGEMHRFLPVYASLQGARIAEIDVHHRPRVAGRSKYGLERIGKVILDLLLVKFLASYSAKPIHLFGGFGLFCLAASLLPIGLAIYFKFAPFPEQQKDFVETPLPVMAAVTILVGFLSLFQGLLAEILNRTYFESQGKRTYSLKRVVRGGRSLAARERSG